MQTIWKYEISITDRQTILMPKGARILSFQLQNNIPCIWAIVNTEAKKETRTFLVLGTGNIFSIKNKLNFMGTIQDSNGFVWHLFEQL